MKNQFIKIFTSLFLLFIGMSLKAHEVRPAYLQVNQLTPNSYSVLWKVPRTVDKVLDIQPKFDNEFTLKETQPPQILDAFVLYSYTLSGDKSLANTELSIDKLNTTSIDALAEIRFLDGQNHSFLLQPANNSITIPAQENKWNVAKTYTSLGVEHILLGYDHLLFVLALMLITTGIGKLLKTITAFTIAHSITLSFAALGIANLPGPPVEAVIALSIVFLALEIFKMQEGKPTLTSQKPWLVAFSFGLLHGFGFAGALQDIGLPQKEIPMALATFNIGVELGQIFFILIVSALIWVIQKFIPQNSKSKKIIPYAIGSIAVFWFIQRISNF